MSRYQPGDGHESVFIAKVQLPLRLQQIYPTELIKRVKALGKRLLPLQVEEDSLTAPTSSILTKEVCVSGYNCL